MLLFVQDFAKVNSLSPQINTSTQKQRRNTGINPRDKLQIGLVDLPLALPWMCAISYLDMPSGLQHPHTNTQDIHNTSLWSDTKPSELTFTHLPPKPSALRPLAALLLLSFGQKNMSFPSGSSSSRQLVSPQNCCQFTQCSVTFPGPCCLPLPPP